VGLFFYWDPFSIEGIIKKKIINFDFSETANTWCWGCRVLGIKVKPTSLVADPACGFAPP